MASFEWMNAAGVTYQLNGNVFTGWTLDISGPGLAYPEVRHIPWGNVLTGNGEVCNLVTLPFTTTYVVVPPGVDGRVNIVASLAGNATVFVAGTATISTDISLASGLTVYVDGGYATAVSGKIGGALGGTTVYLDNGGTFAPSSALFGVLQGLTINFGANGGTFVANVGGTLFGLLDGLTINGFDMAKDQIQFQDVTGACTGYTISGSGTGTQTITLLDSAGHTLGSVGVHGAGLQDGSFHQGQTGPLKVVDAGSGSDWTVTIDPEQAVIPCFFAGTRIATPDGEVAVEDIRAGTLVRLADGRNVPVRWVGWREIATRFADPLRALPIRIKAGAIGENLPARDLLLSPDHAVFLDGVLVNAGALVNGTSIVREENVPETFTYYHVELAAHDLLLADGLASESFIDNIERDNFHNWDARETPAHEIAEMPHPRAKSHRQVPQAIRAALAARAAAFGAEEAAAA